MSGEGVLPAIPEHMATRVLDLDPLTTELLTGYSVQFADLGAMGPAWTVIEELCFLYGNGSGQSFGLLAEETLFALKNVRVERELSFNPASLEPLPGFQPSGRSHPTSPRETMRRKRGR